MAQFFALGPNEFINVDHIKLYRQFWDRQSQETTTYFYMMDGSKFECTGTGFDPVEYGPCIPAAQGSCAISVFCHDGADGRSRPTIYEFNYYAIVGWRVDMSSQGYSLASPIYLETPPKAGLWFPTADGKFQKLEEYTVASLEEAGQLELTEAQEEWDKTHK